MKGNLKMTLFLFIIFLLIILHNSSVKAFSSNDVIIENKLQSNLLYIDNEENISIKGSELIKLLSDTNKLEKYVQQDNRVYDNIYIKVDKNVESVDAICNNQKKELKLIEKNGQSYAECPVAIAVKYNNTYYLASLNLDGIEEFNNNIKLELKKSDNTLDQKEINVSISEGDESFNSVSTDLNSIINGKNTFFGGEGCNYVENVVCERNMLKGDCYITVSMNVYVGDSINVEPFGTLNYAGKGDQEYGRQKYQYKAVILNKKILNDRIILKIVNSKYNLLHFCDITFTGSKVEIPSSLINCIDKNSNVRLSSDSNVIPYNTKINVQKLTNGSVYNLANQILNSYVTNMNVYNIDLISDDIKIQPNGNVKLSIPIADNADISKLVAYRVSSNKEITEYSYKVEKIDNKNYASIQTNHFSTYVIGEKKNLRNNDEENNKKTDIVSNASNEKSNVKEHILDNEPKTGRNKINILSIIEVIVSLIHEF